MLLPRLLLLRLLLLRLLLLRRLLPPWLLLLGLLLAAGRHRGDTISPAPGGIEIWAALPPFGTTLWGFRGAVEERGGPWGEPLTPLPWSAGALMPVLSSPARSAAPS